MSKNRGKTTEESIWKQKQFNLIHMVVFGLIIVVLIIGSDLIRNGIRNSTGQEITVSGSGQMGLGNENNTDVPNIIGDLPFMETPEITGHRATLDHGNHSHELVVTRQQVEDRLNRDLNVVRNALNMTEETFIALMESQQFFDGHETTELTLFMMDSLEHFLLEVYMDHLIAKYGITATQEQLDDLLNFYMTAFAALEMEGYDTEELFQLEFGMSFQEWIDTEMEIMVLRQLLPEQLPISEEVVMGEAEMLFSMLGNFARVSHVLVDSQVEAMRIYTDVRNGTDINEFEGYNLDSAIFYEFHRGQMVDEFENWAFTSEYGDLAIVETQFGFHVMLSHGLTEGVSEPHLAAAQRRIADDIIFDGFLDLVWEPINE